MATTSTEDEKVAAGALVALSVREVQCVRSRGWCYTINNYDNACVEKVRDLCRDSRYAIFGYETGDSGTPHLQGYILFQHPRYFGAVKRMFAPGHVEPSRGSPEQNEKYCSKSGVFEQFGELPPTAGQRGAIEKARWNSARNAAVRGMLEEIPDDIFIRYYGNIRNIMKDNIKSPPDLDNTTGEWYWGRTGVGKSRLARTLYPGAFIKGKNKWWDGYSNEEAVILDDVDPHDSTWIGYYLKIWADHYAFPAEIKGGALRIRPVKFVVTSQYCIGSVFMDPETQEALARRFNEIHIE